MIGVRRLRADDGSVLPLTVFYGVLGLALILLVVAATSLYLERKRLFTIADGAALAGAEAFELADVTVRDGSPHAVLTDALVAHAASGYLNDADIRGFDGLSVTAAGSPDGESARVALSAVWHPPVVSLFVPDGVQLEVSSVARSVFWQ